MQPPALVTIPAKTLVGLRVRTSFAHDQTSLLWRTFRPRVGEIEGRPDDLFHSVQLYPAGLTAATLTLTTEFEKWATVEVAAGAAVPAGMEMLTLPAGLYAVFRHRGLPSDFPATLRFIFGEWLPASGYAPDDRPYFETFDSAYSPFDPAAEEDVWVPVRLQR